MDDLFPRLIPAIAGAIAGGLFGLLGSLIGVIWAYQFKEKEIRYSRVYEKQMEVLATIYRYMVDIESACEELLSATKASREDAASASPERMAESRSAVQSALREAKLIAGDGVKFGHDSPEVDP